MTTSFSPRPAPLASVHRPRSWRTAVVTSAVAVLIAAALLVPVPVLVPVVAACAFVALIVAVARWSARDGFSVRQQRPDDPRDLLGARLTGFRD